MPTKAVTKRAPLRDPTPAEARSILDARANQAERPGRASLTFQISGDKATISNSHTDGDGWGLALQETFGTTSRDFVNDALLKLNAVLDVCPGSGSVAINAALALIGGIAPQDEAQAAIAVQIAATHSASIEMTRRALTNAKAGYVEAAASYTGMATKLSRTMAAHVEALAKLRGGGRQIIEHRYIQVNAANAVVGDHTQAMFGAVSTPQGNIENVHQPRDPRTLAFEPGAPLPCPQPPREPLSGAGDARAEALQVARRQEPRRAHRQSERAVQARAAN